MKKNNAMLPTRDFVRRKPIVAEIRLLRLELVPSDSCPTTLLGSQWLAAQPQENLSPAQAAQDLSLPVWAPASVVAKRLKTLQMRYPPEQFPTQHVAWRPAADLLGNPVKRLNWYWQSAEIPHFPIHLEGGEPQWRKESGDVLMSVCVEKGLP